MFSSIFSLFVVDLVDLDKWLIGAFFVRIALKIIAILLIIWSQLVDFPWMDWEEHEVRIGDCLFSGYVIIAYFLIF